MDSRCRSAAAVHVSAYGIHALEGLPPQWRRALLVRLLRRSLLVRFASLIRRCTRAHHHTLPPHATLTHGAWSAQFYRRQASLTCSQLAGVAALRALVLDAHTTAAARATRALHPAAPAATHPPPLSLGARRCRHPPPPPRHDCARCHGPITHMPTFLHRQLPPHFLRTSAKRAPQQAQHTLPPSTVSAQFTFTAT